MAREELRRSALAGAGSGVLAGIVFAAMDMVGANMMHMPAVMPLRMFASIVLGRSAMGPVSLGAAVLVGIVVHVVLSGGFGALYGAVNTNASAESRSSIGRQAGLGLLYGLALWLINFHVIARIAYPWFLTVAQLPQLLMHAMFFGLPLGVFFAAAERRVLHVPVAGGHKA